MTCSQRPKPAPVSEVEAFHKGPSDEEAASLVVKGGGQRHHERKGERRRVMEAGGRSA